MPEMRFVIEWPDGTCEECYSPSLVIRDFLQEGGTYPLADFLERSRQALRIASDRVEAKFGFPCTLALGQLGRIEQMAGTFEDPASSVVVRKFQLLKEQ